MFKKSFGVLQKVGQALMLLLLYYLQQGYCLELVMLRNKKQCLTSCRFCQQIGFS